MEKINVAELLKDCPKGMELYSPLCGKCFFDHLSFGTIICKKQNMQEITFTCDGYYMLPVFDTCECMIFPSKDQRDWSKFQRPFLFKDGDVVSTINGKWLGIIKKPVGGVVYETYITVFDGAFVYTNNMCGFERLATEDEKQKLFQTIKDNGYKWDNESKVLKKLIKPKFKVGDKIIPKDSNICVPVKITGVSDEFYYSNTKNSVGILSVADQDDWELVPDKFDISSLIPFESRVLFRNTGEDIWKPAIFGCYLKDKSAPYYALGGTC